MLCQSCAQCSLLLNCYRRQVLLSSIWYFTPSNFGHFYPCLSLPLHAHPYFSFYPYPFSPSLETTTQVPTPATPTNEMGSAQGMFNQVVIEFDGHGVAWSCLAIAMSRWSDCIVRTCNVLSPLCRGHWSFSPTVHGTVILLAPVEQNSQLRLRHRVLRAHRC